MYCQYDLKSFNLYADEVWPTLTSNLYSVVYFYLSILFPLVQCVSLLLLYISTPSCRTYLLIKLHEITNI